MEYSVNEGRRTFLRRGAMGAGAVWMLSLQELAARGGHRGPVVIDGVSPYGPIRPQKDETTGLELLKLPEGFRYWSFVQLDGRPAVGWRRLSESPRWHGRRR